MKKISEGKNKRIKWSFSICHKDDAVIAQSIRLFPNHYGKVEIIGRDGEGQIKADGILTKQKKTLAMKTADCIPILVYWPNEKWIGILHFGYKGLLYGLTNNLLKKTNELNLNIADASFLFGPSICKNCYSHKSFLRKLKWFILKLNYPEFADKSNGYHFDLAGAAESELLKIGAVRKNIKSTSVDCTNCKLKVSRHYGNQDSGVLTILANM